jgi:acyl-homoserine lactone synthase
MLRKLTQTTPQARGIAMSTQTMMSLCASQMGRPHLKVHIVTAANRALYREQLEQMHQLRHRIFVEELGWAALASPEQLEIDEFDDRHAVYLLACRDGEVHGSLRLLPTWRRCMITERFPDYLQGRSAPVGPDAWEWTRWCPGSVRSAKNLIRARSALIVAALEFACSRNIETYLTFCELKFVGQLEELGWRPTPLCLPRDFSEGVAIAVSWAVNTDLLNATRRLLRLSGPVSFEAPCGSEDEIGRRPAELEAMLFARPLANSGLFAHSQIEGRA